MPTLELKEYTVSYHEVNVVFISVRATSAEDAIKRVGQGLGKYESGEYSHVLPNTYSAQLSEE